MMAVFGFPKQDFCISVSLGKLPYTGVCKLEVMYNYF